MFSVYQAIVLGIVQGLTEFLPVSSSAHLILVPWLLKWQEDPGLAFDVVLHLGTLLALLIFYWREWLAMVMSLGNGDRVQRRLLFLLIVASVPGAIIGVLLEKQAETIFRSPVLIACTLATLGVLLWAADAIGSKKRKIGDLTLDRRRPHRAEPGARDNPGRLPLRGDDYHRPRPRHRARRCGKFFIPDGDADHRRRRPDRSAQVLSLGPHRPARMGLCGLGGFRADRDRRGC